MALVSISEAARLTKKGRSTIQRHMKQGKLSISYDDTGNKKLDTSELLRVYGSFDTCINIDKSMHYNTHDKVTDGTYKITRLAVLEAENAALKNHIESLNKALLLLEDKTKEKPPVQKKWWQWFK